MSTPAAKSRYAEVDAIRRLVDGDMRAVDHLIRDRLSSDVALINQLGAYIVNSGGKRLRPLVVLLAARACGYRGDDHVQAATIIEFIHTATLLHDDVVDESDLRRGRDTANAVWGNAASVLVGDFLYSRSFQMMVELNRMPVMRIMADTTNAIAEGEVMQLLYVHDPDTDEARYMDVIRHKTAVLFQAAARLGAVLADRPTREEQALADYGLHLGMAFQLVDDLLDYSAGSAELGKNIGDDLAEGKPTLPLIHVIRHGTPAQRQLVREAVEQGGRERIDEVIKAIESTGAIDYTARLARGETAKALSALAVLPNSGYRDALIGLAEFSAGRTY
jgi:octaprenyl-diphosphate synthase